MDTALGHQHVAQSQHESALRDYKSFLELFVPVSRSLSRRSLPPFSLFKPRTNRLISLLLDRIYGEQLPPFQIERNGFLGLVSSF